jgi:ribosomal protein L7/L12
MIQSIECPNCSAPLEFDGSQAVVKCTYCGATVSIAQSIPGASMPDPQVPDPSLTEVAVLVRAGKRVQATIRYREITGAGLKEAKQAIDRFVAGEALRRPNRLTGA